MHAHTHTNEEEEEWRQVMLGYIPEVAGLLVLDVGFVVVFVCSKCFPLT